MSEHRTTLRGVEEMALDVRMLARELNLVPADEGWYIERGSSTMGNSWKLYASVDGGKTRRILVFTGPNGYIGKTARQARDFLEHIWEALNYVQMMQEKR